MELEVLSREESVGSYRADILCKDSSNGNFVVIENQLEQTDHKHLGQIATYAAGLNASCCIWIAKSFTEEHRAAIDWLNSISDDSHNFFAIEVKLYRIGDSPLAPMFNVVAKPNDWSKSIKKRVDNVPLTNTKLLQQEYWAAFADYVKKQPKPIFRTQKTQPQHWSNISIGKSAANLALTVDSRQKVIKIWLQIQGKDPKANYDLLHKERYEKSQKEFEYALRWDRLDNKKISYIELKTNGDFTNKSAWDAQFEWFYINVEKFILQFQEAVKKLK